ncbi:hypothetical protein BOO69_02745 [Sulfitobacter alexandrii]|uniref:Histidine phosphatase family protein n=1 Tax=Sulfitobacter alexandrii TaxID=1917485 RepID=A0A1J0WDQ7_9RHOB|nr:hypothetical protein BOO69_02745 [Sulfitobacter alexandrii]
MTAVNAERILVLVRHAPTAWNRDGLVMGQTDIPLDAMGRHEATIAAYTAGLQGMSIDGLFCSPMKRCVQTAEALGIVLDLETQLVPGLKERGWGPFEGQPKSERSRGSEAQGVEDLYDLTIRVAEALCWIGERATTPLIVTHSGVIRVALARSGQSSDARVPHLTPIRVRWKPTARK